MTTTEPAHEPQAQDSGQRAAVAPSRGGRPTRWKAVLWLLTGAALALALIYPLTGDRASMWVLLLFVPFSLIHGIRRYGVKVLIIFLVETLVVSNFFENLSISTGFPFGHYHYTGEPQLFQVPIQIGPIYFGLGYACWLVASTLLDAADARLDLRSRLGRINVVALPLLAGAIMTMYDLGTDSLASTVSKDWVWERGGGVFGVPFTNYLGWWLTTYIFFQLFALYLARSKAPVRTEGRSSLLQPVVLYAGLGLTSVPYFAAASTTTVTDATGFVWNEHALNETMMTINIFGVVIIALLALIKLLRNDVEAKGLG
ncbi:MAG TPA: carotenoid biosynthesis protein [Kribbella sp.]|uniref:carotenoid biosynthesis protein n=1 Tax=Kribbella sp. TaxID=1871183 RepID=UPI002D77E108|nr:carotenoid biosynthesis protein [Kribbella sp.]HET6294082.1 carotenoid biosynthesis protein [Kribbella sp.]